jgi:membrane protease subunit (stomatin/prohibitin family)
VFTDLRWGTQEPVAFKDSTLGLVRLRAFGNYTLRVVDGVAFVNQIVGTAGHFATDQLEGYLRDVIVARLNDYLGETLESVFDLPAVYDETGLAMRQRLAPDFTKYGLELVDFYVQSITPPAEVQQVIDQQGGLALIKDMPAYMQYQVAAAIGRSQSGALGGGAADQIVGAGLGVGVGLMVPGLIREAMLGGGHPVPGGPARGAAGAPAGAAAASAPAPGTAAAEPAHASCHACGSGVTPESRFCSTCGARLGKRETP